MKNNIWHFKSKSKKQKTKLTNYFNVYLSIVFNINVSGKL